MEISEVRVKLVSNSKERLRAFCSITIENDFVIRDLKIIDGANGTFVAMPSRKLSDRCPKCGYKNHMRAHFCNECGKELGEQHGKRANKRGKLHADIAHPINAGCRERIQNIVIGAFEEELEKSKQPDYRPPDFDFGDDTHDDDQESHSAKPKDSARRPERAPSRTPEPAEEPADDGGGYDDLIAELKNDAKARRQQRDTGNRGFGPPREKAAETATEPLAPATFDGHDDPVGFGPPPEEVTTPAEEPRESESLAPATSGTSDSSMGSGTPTERPPHDDGFGAGLL
jgi:stage V sporulation protein G